MLYKNFFSNDFEHMESEDSIVILGESLDVMRSMKSRSVDLIFADEPYNIGKNFGNNYDSWSSKEEYIDWNKKWISEAMRILKDSGTIYIMSATQFMPFIDVFMQDNYNVLSRVVWQYDSSGVQSKKMFGSLYEPILICNKSNKSSYIFNSSDILVETKTGSKRKLMDYRKNPPVPYSTTKVPGNVWNFSRVRYRMHEYENHPTQKPESLLERVIKASSNIGDVIFDPFSGSFTTGAVAKKLGRKSISIDMNYDYYKIGLRRLNITQEYKGEKLQKDLMRKTKNKSKKSRLNENQIKLNLESGLENGKKDS